FPVADVVTPNAFELAYLAGSGGDPATAVPADITTQDALLAAVDRVRGRGPSTALVTSIEDGSAVVPEPGGSSGDGDTGEHFGLTGDAGSPTISTIAVDDSGAYRVRTPRLPLEANGAGDVTTALFVVHLLEHGIASALARTASSVYAV